MMSSIVESNASTGVTCPVCLKELTNGKLIGELGKPETCDHFFCFMCIFEWSKNVNTCPVDRLKFNQILVYTSLHESPVKKVVVPDNALLVSEDETFCEVCHQSTHEDRLLLCDGCDKGYHLECLVPPLTEIPVGDWYCESCDQIVQSQYSISMSSPGEDSDYQPNNLRGFELDLSSDVDITGSDYDSTSESSVIIVDSEPESDLNPSLGTSVDNQISSSGDNSSYVSGDLSSMNTTLQYDPLLPTSTEHEEVMIIEDSDSEDFPSKPSKRRINQELSSLSSESDSIILKRERKKNVFYVGSDSEEETAKFFTKNTQSASHGSCVTRKERSGVYLSSDDQSLDSEHCKLMLPPRMKALLEPALNHSPATSNVQDSNTSGLCNRIHSHKNPQDKEEKPSTSRENVSGTPKNKKPGKKRKRSKKIISLRRRVDKRLRHGRKKCQVKSNPVPEVRTRSRARTAATHTPRPNPMRDAVRESYRHDNKLEGLEWARTVLAMSANTPRRALFFQTPMSGYVERHRNFPTVYRTYGFTPNRNNPLRPSLTSSATPISLFPENKKGDTHADADASSSKVLSPARKKKKLTTKERTAREISRRLSHGRPLSHVLVTPVKLQANGRKRSVVTSEDTGEMSSESACSSDLLGELCQGLDDLENKDNIIERDGTIKPIRNERSDVQDSATPLYDSMSAIKSGVTLDKPTELSANSTLFGLSANTQDKAFGIVSLSRKTLKKQNDLTKSFFPILRKPLVSNHSGSNRHCKDRSILTDIQTSVRRDSLQDYTIPKLASSCKNHSLNVHMANPDSVQVSHSSRSSDVEPNSEIASNVTSSNAESSCLDNTKSVNPKLHSTKEISVKPTNIKSNDLDTVKFCTKSDNRSSSSIGASTDYSSLPSSITSLEKEQEDNLTADHNFSNSSGVQSPNNHFEVTRTQTYNLTPKTIIRRALDVHFDRGEITNRKYMRILERANRKVEDGLARSSYMNQQRVEKLVADYVDAYSYREPS